MKRFGPHLLMDLQVSSNKLNDGPFWRQILVDLVDKIGMTPLSKPVIHASTCTNSAWNPPTATGLSGFIVLAESHVSFHTFVESQYVFIDVFSCRKFDKYEVWKFLDDTLSIQSSDMTEVDRGQNFPFKV